MASVLTPLPFAKTGFRRWLTYLMVPALVILPLPFTPDTATGSPSTYLHWNGKSAAAPHGVPVYVHKAVQAGNRLQGKPYVWGGGHRKLYDRGYDCSGSVSFILHMAGLLPGPLTSTGFAKYGEPGPGKYITIYSKNGHVFMSVCGLRFDTSDMGAGRGDGPKWRPKSRKFSGYAMRHPKGL